MALSRDERVEILKHAVVKYVEQEWRAPVLDAQLDVDLRNERMYGPTVATDRVIDHVLPTLREHYISENEKGKPQTSPSEDQD